MPAGRQLDLFSANQVEPAPAALEFSVERELAAKLPETIRFGTSSWTFPGWSGLVYPLGTGERELMERGLELYAKNPLFRTVGIDRSYYRPLEPSELERYAAQLPSGFRCVTKVYGQITSAVEPRTREQNPQFLDVDLFESEVLGPIERHFMAHTGPLVFELAPLRPAELPEPQRFADRLALFLGRLPKGFQYAVELRNRELFTHRYLDALRAHGVAHVLSFWERMPELGAQLAVPGVLTADFAVARLLIPPGERYADRKNELFPFDRIVHAEERMRSDVVRLFEACHALGKVLFVIVNNKAEGSSPLTILALAERLTTPF